jgi:hypothetical protein
MRIRPAFKASWVGSRAHPRASRIIHAVTHGSLALRMMRPASPASVDVCAGSVPSSHCERTEGGTAAAQVDQVACCSRSVRRPRPAWAAMASLHSGQYQWNQWDQRCFHSAFWASETDDRITVTVAWCGERCDVHHV